MGRKHKRSPKAIKVEGVKQEGATDAASSSSPTRSERDSGKFRTWQGDKLASLKVENRTPVLELLQRMDGTAAPVAAAAVNVGDAVMALVEAAQAVLALPVA